jgi:ribosomal protein S18 acetylase RimI-like enzyme
MEAAMPATQTTQTLGIRQARREDVPAIVRLLADDPLGGTREEPSDPLPQAYWDAFDAMVLQGGNMLIVAEQDGVVVGCLQLTFIPSLTLRGTKRAQIEGVRVDASRRSRHIGERMIRHAMELARAEGCGVMQLTTNKVRADAQRFYERLGFAASHIGMKATLS